MTAEEVLRERRRAHRLTRRIIRFLKESWAWEIRLLPLQTDRRLLKKLGFDSPIVGVTMETERVIGIDPAYEDFFAVLIHECLHAIEPQIDEKGILALETQVRKHLTPYYAKHLLIWASKRLR